MEAAPSGPDQASPSQTALPWEQKLYSAPPPSPPSGRSSGSSPHPILPTAQQVLGIHHPHPGVQGPVCMVHHCVLTPRRAGPQHMPAGAMTSAHESISCAGQVAGGHARHPSRTTLASFPRITSLLGPTVNLPSTLEPPDWWGGRGREIRDSRVETGERWSEDEGQKGLTGPQPGPDPIAAPRFLETL